MAEQQKEHAVELDHSQFCCAVCLDLLKEPVTIHCGHSYCTSCIEGCWDHEEERGKYSCPQCRETFNPRPALRRNNMLAEVVEKLKMTSTQQASPSAALACAGPADVACDFCCGTKPKKATMSCLTCLASYCPAHLQPHYTVPVLKTHQLVSATIPLQDKMCTKHNKLMEAYCKTDKRCICYLCTIDEHKCHRIISATAERATEQEMLIVRLKRVQKREKEREKELNELSRAVNHFKSCTQTTVKSCDKIFDELISSIKKRRILMTMLIKFQEKTAVAQAEELQLQLEEEVTKLKRRDADLEELSHTDDDIHFIQTFQSLSTSCESPDLPAGAVVLPQRSIGAVTDRVSELRENMEKLLKDTWPVISATVGAADVVLPPVPKKRNEFLLYCRPLTLDQNSVYRYLSLSQKNRRVTREHYEKYYSAHPDRFTNVTQVLCREGLSERCYWEVSWSGGTWSVAVSYKDISRTYESEFGKNNKSWSLVCSLGCYVFRHNTKIELVSGPNSSRIGVFLDYKAGTLSFYSISDTMTLLHTVHNTFTQPLYPGLGLKSAGSSAGHYAELTKLW
ncbi:tripartite motif-containing protein 16-like [Seriola dumerili]|uniref:tripartite motif-containing protein 16-like n=1 Tax=Seriola dumerili TaxID=41447 RepID=UPI000BBE137D|nr:tripartite motif-containing protein 16-like [Seriola dumerili]